MKFLLDTNTCVFIIRKKSPLALQRLRHHAAGVVGISSITLAELRYGADKSQDPAKNHAALNGFLAPLEIVEFEAQAAGHYGVIRADLERRGLPIGPLDMLIAAHAKSMGFIVVTNNVSEFSSVPGLIVEDWTVP
ncbi:MAG: type II toxin-antitoxin system VapC family toxin [Planctomycetes bacterium]|nr:type II toxin-antitoxin system VapC family toxin [Planctomycetota bacterium]